MTEQELRALVRQAIDAHARSAAGVPAAPPPGGVSRHASHALFVVPSGGDSDGPCLIEPAVLCNHCGYCKSYGH
jgi:hypothetical protein